MGDVIGRSTGIYYQLLVRVLPSGIAVAKPINIPCGHRRVGARLFITHRCELLRSCSTEFLHENHEYECINYNRARREKLIEKHIVCLTIGRIWNNKVSTFGLSSPNKGNVTCDVWENKTKSRENEKEDYFSAILQIEYTQPRKKITFIF